MMASFSAQAAARARPAVRLLVAWAQRESQAAPQPATLLPQQQHLEPQAPAEPELRAPPDRGALQELQATGRQLQGEGKAPHRLELQGQLRGHRELREAHLGEVREPQPHRGQRRAAQHQGRQGLLEVRALRGQGLGEQQAQQRGRRGLQGHRQGLREHQAAHLGEVREQRQHHLGEVREVRERQAPRPPSLALQSTPPVGRLVKAQAATAQKMGEQVRLPASDELNGEQPAHCFPEPHSLTCWHLLLLLAGSPVKNLRHCNSFALEPS